MHHRPSFCWISYQETYSHGFCYSDIEIWCYNMTQLAAYKWLQTRSHVCSTSFEDVPGWRKVPFRLLRLPEVLLHVPEVYCYVLHQLWANLAWKGELYSRTSGWPLSVLTKQPSPAYVQTMSHLQHIRSPSTWLLATKTHMSEGVDHGCTRPTH